MHFLSLRMHKVQWIGWLSLVLLFSSSSHGQWEAQGWLDSLSSLAEGYSDLVDRMHAERTMETQALEAVASGDLERQREEARIDCLANRLLAEEYQPYDFDIRETMWCKGSGAGRREPGIPSASPSDTYLALRESEVIDPFPNAHLIPDLPWIRVIREQVWSGFIARLNQDLQFTLSSLESAGSQVYEIAMVIERQRLIAHLGSIPSLRDTFGSNVLPNSISVTPEEYATLAIQSWNELRSRIDNQSVLPKTTWYQMRATQLDSFYDLLTSIPGLLPITQR